MHRIHVQVPLQGVEDIRIGVGAADDGVGSRGQVRQTPGVSREGTEGRLLLANVGTVGLGILLRPVSHVSNMTVPRLETLCRT